MTLPVTLAAGQKLTALLTPNDGISTEYSTCFPVSATGPANDNFVDAQDLSGLPIPAYVAGPGGQPTDTVSIDGTTEGSTREPSEFDVTQGQATNGTVWYRFTSPVGGFAGRLGVRVTPGFEVIGAVTALPVDQPPDVQHLSYARGNTWPPSGLPFYRMEPGQTLWLQVRAQGEANPNPDGPFTLELFQAPNEQDDIGNAYDIAFGTPWRDGLSWYGDGDTFHVTQDRPELGPNMWFTATFDRAGRFNFTAWSETAMGDGSTRPLSLTLFRSPTLARVADPGALPALAVAHVDSTFVSGSGHPLGTSGQVAQLIDVPVTAGRYYWSVEQGDQGPTFFGLQSNYHASALTTDPLTVVLAGSGGGHVSSNPSGIICGTDPGSVACVNQFSAGSTVTLTATVAPPVVGSSSAFTGWSGGGCPTDGTPTCTVTMDADQDGDRDLHRVHPGEPDQGRLRGRHHPLQPGPDQWFGSRDGRPGLPHWASHLLGSVRDRPTERLDRDSRPRVNLPGLVRWRLPHRRHPHLHDLHQQRPQHHRHLRPDWVHAHGRQGRERIGDRVVGPGRDQLRVDVFRGLRPDGRHLRRRSAHRFARRRLGLHRLDRRRLPHRRDAHLRRQHEPRAVGDGNLPARHTHRDRAQERSGVRDGDVHSGRDRLRTDVLRPVHGARSHR